VRVRWASWGAFGLICLLLVVALVLGVSFGSTELATVVFVLGNGAVGALVASRLPRHPVGWLLLAASACFAFGGLVITYVEQADSRSFPLTPIVVLAGNWSFGLGVVLASVFVLLFFPTGRLPSPRWTGVLWLAGIATLMLLVGVSLSPSNFEGLSIDNPWALPPDDWRGVVFEGGGLLSVLVAMIAAVGSLIIRFRSGSDLERRQLKWVVFAVLIAVAGIVGTYVIELVNGPSNFSDDLENSVITFGLALVPIAIGLAILRYRLYDIDRLISRTVSYALVVGLLAFRRPVGGGGGDSRRLRPVQPAASPDSAAGRSSLQPLSLRRGAGCGDVLGPFERGSGPREGPGRVARGGFGDHAT
jgi:hypothetical protein